MEAPPPLAAVEGPHALVTNNAPVSKEDCNICPRCHKPKPKPMPKKMVGTSLRCSYPKVKEEIDVFPRIVEPLAKVKPVRIEEALRKKPRVRLAAPIREPPHTRSQTLAALRHENTTLKEGYTLLDCCWRRILELHLPEAKYMEVVKKISDAL